MDHNVNVGRTERVSLNVAALLSSKRLPCGAGPVAQVMLLIGAAVFCTLPLTVHGCSSGMAHSSLPLCGAHREAKAHCGLLHGHLRLLGITQPYHDA